MSWSFDDTKPIYLQIMEKIKLQIVSHELEPYRERFGERGWGQSQYHPARLV